MVVYPKEFENFIQNTIAALENELAKLEDKKSHSFQDSDKLIQCLEGIISGTILKFIILPVYKYFFIELTNVDGDLIIEIKTINNDTLIYYLHRSGPDALKRLGFVIKEKYAKLMFREFDSGKILSVMELLSVIFFEVFMLFGNKRAVIKIIF